MDFLGSGFEGFCEAIEKTDITIAFCERFDETSDIWNFESHHHEYIEIVYFLSGAAVVTASDTSMQLSHCSYVIYPKGVNHIEHLKYDGQRSEIICVWVDIPGLDLPRLIRRQDKEGKVKWMMEKLHREYHCKQRCDALVNHYLKAITLYIARDVFATDSSPDPLGEVILYIREHLADQHKLKDLADRIFVSESYLCRIFKQRMGMTIIEYLRAIRVETAQFILASTNKSIEEVSGIVGYSSPKYFYTAFHKCTGMSPSEFKNRYKI